MKFDNHEYLKHNNCIDAFIRVKSVTMDTGQTAIIWAYWMVQGVDMHWYCQHAERLFIKAEQYEKWLPYTPTGSMLT